MMFVTSADQIDALPGSIDPVHYGKTRNYINGGVTRLSPYISRGVLHTRQIAQQVLHRGYQPYQAESLLKELAWRDYFQQVWMALGDGINSDIKQPQQKVLHHALPQNLAIANTGIQAIDEGIRHLFSTGYMHNHLRMYVASMACNVGQSHWLQPARWMYYHLLDADWASNALSWQWVAGSFSSKKYYANQENINKYCSSAQRKTFLDISYEEFDELPLPETLQQTTMPQLTCTLPATEPLQIDDELPIYLYNFYNLDHHWDQEVNANRVLLLEPAFFDQYPVSEKTMQFILALANNISGIQIAVGAFETLFPPNCHHRIHYKEHPCNRHYKGTQHARQWMFPQVTGYYPSFFGYWKKCEKQLDQLF